MSYPYGTIYGLVCPVSKKVIYIGQTFSPLAKRLKEHTILKSGKSKYEKWMNAQIHAGRRKKINIVTIRANVYANDINDIEMYYIQYFSKSRELINTVNAGQLLPYKQRWCDMAGDSLGIESKLRIYRTK